MDAEIESKREAEDRRGEEAGWEISRPLGGSRATVPPFSLALKQGEIDE